jgi:ATP-binding cassette subfamily B multidrug efflux pump
MQTGPAIRESLVSLFTAVWFIPIYGTSSLILLASADRWLALPVLMWFAGYICCAISCRACKESRR